MRYIKSLGCAAVVAVALLAVAGGAAATTLCKNNANTATCNETYGPNAIIEAELNKGTKVVFENTMGASLNSNCTESHFRAKVTNAGNATETVKAAMESLTFGGVNCSTKVIEMKTLEIHHIANTDNGTLTVSEFELETTIGGEPCIYGGASVDLGILDGGNPASLTINAILSKINACVIGPATIRWTGTYTLTSPEKGKLWIAAG